MVKTIDNIDKVKLLLGELRGAEGLVSGRIVEYFPEVEMGVRDSLVRFNFEEEFPKARGLYFVTDLKGDLLYIGIASSLKIRWRKHHQYIKCRDAGAAYVYFWKTRLENIAFVEYGFFASLRTLLNKVGVLREEKKKPKPVLDGENRRIRRRPKEDPEFLLKKLFLCLVDGESLSGVFSDDVFFDYDDGRVLFPTIYYSKSKTLLKERVELVRLTGFGLLLKDYFLNNSEAVKKDGKTKPAEYATYKANSDSLLKFFETIRQPHIAEEYIRLFEINPNQNKPLTAIFSQILKRFGLVNKQCGGNKTSREYRISLDLSGKIKPLVGLGEREALVFMESLFICWEDKIKSKSSKPLHKKLTKVTVEEGAYFWAGACTKAEPSASIKGSRLGWGTNPKSYKMDCSRLGWTTNPKSFKIDWSWLGWNNPYVYIKRSN